MVYQGFNKVSDLPKGELTLDLGEKPLLQKVVSVKFRVCPCSFI